MSYDLMLFRLPDDADPSSAYEAIIGLQESDTTDPGSPTNRPLPDAARIEIARIADALKAWRPSLQEFRPKSPLPWIELNDADLQLQFEIHEGSVSMTMPYFRERAQEMMDCVTGCFELLRAAAGYIAYDPQLGRAVTAADIEALVSQYRGVDSALPAIQAESRRSTKATKKPWWKFW